VSKSASIGISLYLGLTKKEFHAATYTLFGTINFFILGCLYFKPIATKCVAVVPLFNNTIFVLNLSSNKFLALSKYSPCDDIYDESNAI
jgi:hypothetical protein